MAERIMNADESAAFLAGREARDAGRLKAGTQSPQPAPPQCPSCSSFLSPEAQYAPATCPQCGITLPVAPKPQSPPKAGRGRGGTSSSPDGKPARSAKPWRKDSQWLTMISEAMARNVKAAIDAAIGGNGGGTTKLSLAHYGADGNCAAELREEGGKIYLRIGDASVSARAGTQRAAELQARFDAIGAAILP